jgi:hypothetical protein
MKISWSAQSGSATGNSAITAYELYWDNNSGTSNILLTSSTAASHTVSGLVGGKAYKFKVRSQNIYGESAFTSELTVTASSVPAQPAAPSTSIGAAATDIVITWSAPDDNHNSITGYTV